jgi:hypothetical protein
MSTACPFRCSSAAILSSAVRGSIAAQRGRQIEQRCSWAMSASFADDVFTMKERVVAIAPDTPAD